MTDRTYLSFLLVYDIMKQEKMVHMKAILEYEVKERESLLPFLEQNLKDISKKKIKGYLTHGCVYVDHKKVTQYNYSLVPGQKIEIHRSQRSSENTGELDILYEDRDLLVVNKKSGLLTISTEKEKERTLYHMASNYVKKNYKNGKIFIVHRLDRDTSGVVVFAKNEHMKEMLQKNWNELVSYRGYIAILEGNLPKKEGMIHTWLKEDGNYRVHSVKNKKDGKEAITLYKVIKERKDTTIVEIELKTGRKNQIRVHFSELGYPVVGDKKYGARKRSSRLELHAYRLKLRHPVTHREMEWIAPIPEEMK